MCDIKLPNPSAHFKVGQTVVAKVTDIDHEKRRFLLSLRMSECQDVDWAVSGQRVLEEYLEKAAYIADRMKMRGRILTGYLGTVHNCRHLAICAQQTNSHTPSN